MTEFAVMETAENVTQNRTVIADQMIDYLINRQDVFFKSQQRNESDLTAHEKANIANSILQKSKSNFLARFGKQIQEQHLSYFENYMEDEDEGYDLKFYIQNLKRYFSKKRTTDIKNRRYGALNKLVKDDDYFTETEMMKRNPLLYDQLVGQYMTQEEKNKRDNINTQNITFVNILLEGIDRDTTRQKQKEQQKKTLNKSFKSLILKKKLNQLKTVVYYLK